MRRRRLWIAASLILIGGITAAVASMATSGGPGSTGGGPGVHGLLSQIRSSFGDHRLLSASVNGLTLTVKVAAHDEPSSVGATFEAQILASAFHDAQAASGQAPIDSVQFVDAHGKAIPGYGAARVGTDTAGHPLPQIPALAKGACMSAARPLQTPSLTIRSALTLPCAPGALRSGFERQTRPDSLRGSRSRSWPTPWVTRISGRTWWRSTTKLVCRSSSMTTRRAVAAWRTSSPVPGSSSALESQSRELTHPNARDKRSAEPVFRNDA
jgi:hypothetical protein